MRFFISRLLLFLFFKPVWIYSKETIIIRTSEELKQNAFVDVLKNITAANQILQDLIKNYEQLQKIYKSNEEDFSDDNEKGNFKALSSQEKYTTKSFGMTQMIYVGETEESTEENKSGNKDNGSNTIVVESTETKEVNSFLNDSVKDSPSDEIEIGSPETGSPETVSPQTLQHILEDKTLEPEAQSQTDRKTRFSIQKKDKMNLNTNNRNKTRFSIQYKSANRNFKRSNIRHTGDKIKRIVYAEVFSPDKIWHEVVNKPIELKMYKDTNFRMPNDKKPSIKSKPTFGKGKDLSDSMSDSNPDDEVILKEEVKSIMLRKAYGDACLQVAVRKCYKALKAVRKSVCRLRFKCKSALKGSFIENAKKGCIREFANGKNSRDDEEAQEIVFERTINKNVGTDLSKYVDLCLPHLRSQITNEKDLPKSAKDFKTINILRDKFEKACKKLSAKKCRKACKFAYETACSIHRCENSLKKGFQKSCKSECKTAYNLYNAESNSDDDDESESGSD